jgi:GNAT superfamily N-acetyltransferase
MHTQYRDSKEHKSTQKIKQSLVFLQERKLLNPHRFETIWQSEEKSLNVYMSHALSPAMQKMLSNGLKEHSRPFVEDILNTTQNVTLYVGNKNENIYGILSCLIGVQHAYIQLLANPDAAYLMLEALKKYLYENQIRHAASQLLPPEDPLLSAFTKAGYDIVETKSGAGVGKIEVKQATDLPAIEQVVTLVKASHEKGDELCGQLFQRYQTQSTDESQDTFFGAFIENEYHEMMGGVSGHISTKGRTKILHIDSLWIHPEMRGLNLSKILLQAAEQHGRATKCTHAFVHTMEYQAPWLYPKEGFHGFFQHKIGDYKSFLYEKTLKSPHDYRPTF